jgi:hypothetical protein
LLKEVREDSGSVGGTTREEDGGSWSAIRAAQPKKKMGKAKKHIALLNMNEIETSRKKIAHHTAKCKNFSTSAIQIMDFKHQPFLFRENANFESLVHPRWE